VFSTFLSQLYLHLKLVRINLIMLLLRARIVSAQGNVGHVVVAINGELYMGLVQRVYSGYDYHAVLQRTIKSMATRRFYGLLSLEVFSNLHCFWNSARLEFFCGFRTQMLIWVAF